MRGTTLQQGESDDSKTSDVLDNLIRGDMKFL